MQKEVENLKCKLNLENNRDNLIKNYSDVKSLDRLMVEKLIDHIEVGKRIKGTKNVPVKIYWNF